MPNTKYPFLLISLIVLLLSFCKSKTDANEPDPYAGKFISSLNRTDTFLFDLPEQDTSILRLKREHDNSLGLSSLESGFDSIQLRIFFGCFLGEDFLVILRNSNQRWSGELSKLESHIDSLENSTKSRKIITASPKSGWKNLVQQLFKLKILTLPDDDDIPNLIKEYPTDGCGVAVEIATNNVYRLYNYDNPNIYTKRNWQAENIMKIIKLLANEFEIEKRFDIEHKDMWPN